MDTAPIIFLMLVYNSKIQDIGGGNKDSEVHNLRQILVSKISIFSLHISLSCKISAFSNAEMDLTLPSKCNCTAQRTQETGGWKIRCISGCRLAVSRDGSGALLSNSKTKLRMQRCACGGVKEKTFGCKLQRVSKLKLPWLRSTMPGGSLCV